MGILGKKRIADLNPLPLAELRKRTRILVIDDDEKSFPFELLRKEGYAIDYWQRVVNLKSLEQGEFDIIVLDIADIAKEYTPEDGLGILEHIKAVNPCQIVVAFSGLSFDLSKSRFWRMADDCLSKPVDVPKCKRLIDDLIRTRMTPGHYWGAIAETLKHEGFSERKIAGIEDRFTSALRRKDRQSAYEVLKSVSKKAELTTRVAYIGMKIALLLGL